MLYSVAHNRSHTNWLQLPLFRNFYLTYCASEDLSVSECETAVLLLSGHIFNLSDLSQDHKSQCETLLSLIQNNGLAQVCEQLAGSFHLIYFSKTEQSIALYTDPLGDNFTFGTFKSPLGEDFVLSNSLLHFPPSKFKLNSNWVNHYLSGYDEFDRDTPIVGVTASFPGELIRIDQLSSRRIMSYNLAQRMRESLAAAPSSSDAASRDKQRKLVTQEVYETICGSLESFPASSLPPVLSLSSGVDSQSILSVCKSKGINCSVQTIIYKKDRDYSDQTHTWDLLKQSYGFDQEQVVEIDSSQVNNSIPWSRLMQPLYNSWYQFVVDLPALYLNPTSQIHLTGTGGDELFLHRHYFFVAATLAQPSFAPLLDDVRRLRKDLGYHQCVGPISELLKNNLVSYYKDLSYSFLPSDINAKNIDLFLSRFDGDFIDFWIKGSKPYRGINTDRQIRLASGIKLVSPFKDHRLYLILAKLAYEDLIALTVEPWLQKDLISLSGDTSLISPKRSNPFVWRNKHLLNDLLRNAVDPSLAMLRDLEVPSAAYYERHLRHCLQDNTADLEFYRLVSLFFWYQAWKEQGIQI